MSEQDESPKPAPQASVPTKKKTTRKVARKVPKPEPASPLVKSSSLAKMRAERAERQEQKVQEKKIVEDRSVYVVDCPSPYCKGPAWAVVGHPLAAPRTSKGLPMPSRFVDNGLDEDLEFMVKSHGYCAACIEREGVFREVTPSDRLTTKMEVELD